MKKILFVVSVVITLVSCNVNQNKYKKFSIKYATLMQPTIEEGDIVELDTFTKEFNYGDIVVVDYYDEIDSTKYTVMSRIVGMPKDSISVQNGICTINGTKCKTTFIRNGFPTNEIEEELPNGIKVRISVQPKPEKKLDQSTIYVPIDHYYLLSDFRASVEDSRSFGTVTDKEIIGKIVKIEKAEKKSSW